jgi:hypothetical protein
MKSKIKFKNFNNQNFKHKFKIFVLVFIVLSSVYFLYFNDKIFVQSIIQKSLHNEDKEETTKSNSIENFNVSKYVDVCKNRKTQFYDFKMGSTLSNLSPWVIGSNNNCENLCDSTPNCQFFTMKENSAGEVENDVCYLYINALDASNIDRSNMNVKVNCNSTIIPLANSTSSYNGFGYINKNYFKHNKNKFQYKDAYLDKANELIPTLKANRSNLDALANPISGNHPQLTENAQHHTTSMGYWITTFGDLIGVNTNNLTTMNNETDMFNDDIDDNQKNKDLKHLAAISKETPELDNKLVDVKSSNYVNNLFYTILTFIMTITIILLVLYRLNTNAIISDRFMIIYFIVIVILFMLIRFILNK